MSMQQQKKKPLITWQLFQLQFPVAAMVDFRLCARVSLGLPPGEAEDV
jgi:hypothetical protein